MEDTIIKGNGKSRTIKAPPDIPADFSTWRQQLINGTAFLDVNLNTSTGADAGCNVVGTPLSKANLLQDDVADVLELTPPEANVNNALKKLTTRKTITAELHTYIFPNHMVTAVKGTTVVTAAPTAPLGQWAVLQLPELGVWEISMHLPNLTGGVMKTILIDTYGIFYLNFLSGSNTSWGNIIDFARMGIAHKMLPLGFTKSLGVGGSSYDTRIIGFNHDDCADGSGKAPITFQMVRTPVDDNIHTGSANNVMWSGCSLRAQLNSTTYNSIEATVRNAITPVHKRSAWSAGNSPLTTDSLFLLSERESAGGYIQANANEGRQYDYYAEGNSLIAYATSTSVTTQWLRSVSRHDTQRWVYLSSSGTPNTELPSYGRPAFFAFCIG